MADLVDHFQNIINENIDQQTRINEAGVQYQDAVAKARASRGLNPLRLKQFMSQAATEHRDTQLQSAKAQQQAQALREPNAEPASIDPGPDPMQTLMGKGLSGASAGGSVLGSIPEAVAMASHGGPQPAATSGGQEIGTPSNIDPTSGRQILSEERGLVPSHRSQTVRGIATLLQKMGIGQGGWHEVVKQQMETSADYQARIKPRAEGFATVLEQVQAGKAPPQAIGFETQTLVDELGPVAAKEAIARGVAEMRKRLSDRAAEEFRAQLKAKAEGKTPEDTEGRQRRLAQEAFARAHGTQRAKNDEAAAAILERVRSGGPPPNINEQRFLDMQAQLNPKNIMIRDAISGQDTLAPPTVPSQPPTPKPFGAKEVDGVTLELRTQLGRQPTPAEVGKLLGERGFQ